ncbi:hypothetical protein B0T22DRAFT_481584 [Podospora appendiculata]|uniref:Uncharacterized protein n=1 Tax=Podospora appendiculata TaxID=314037 RepID=A0AAE1CEG1_9PEZI|nr:hypothetical protein B0T22DRAFT_481584 [Podospora appendiculata]
MIPEWYMWGLALPADLIRPHGLNDYLGLQYRKWLPHNDRLYIGPQVQIPMPQLPVPAQPLSDLVSDPAQEMWHSQPQEGQLEFCHAFDRAIDQAMLANPAGDVNQQVLDPAPPAIGEDVELPALPAEPFHDLDPAAIPADNPANDLGQLEHWYSDPEEVTRDLFLELAPDPDPAPLANPLPLSGQQHQLPRPLAWPKPPANVANWRID